MERIMCSKCKKVKDETEFYYREKTHRFKSYCKSCESLYQKEYKKLHKERKKKASKRYSIYAIYKGETFLFEGTVKECAEHFKVKEKTIYFMASPALHKRANEKWKIAIRIDDKEE